MSGAVPALPRIASVRHVRTPKGWGADVAYENGVVLKFSNHLSDEAAQDAANKYYAGCAQAGWTEAEMIECFRDKAVTS